MTKALEHPSGEQTTVYRVTVKTMADGSYFQKKVFGPYDQFPAAKAIASRMGGRKRYGYRKNLITNITIEKGTLEWSGEIMQEWTNKEEHNG